MNDLISRQAAIDCEYQVKIINDIEYVMLSEVQMKMRKLPSAQPERKKGEWTDRSDGGRILHPWWETYECSKCGQYGTRIWNFCPNCGADMREREGE